MRSFLTNAPSSGRKVLQHLNEGSSEAEAIMELRFLSGRQVCDV